ncbi:MAG: hypothetical protein QOI44_2714, partial [Actinomycetota bacterium]|nr:hypothetical protein [Actinomycetota bacterium]
MAPAEKPRTWIRWAVVGVVAVLVIVVGGPFVYFQFIEGDAPKAPTIAALPTSTLKAGDARAPLAGTWKVAGPSSLVQYRVKET